MHLLRRSAAPLTLLALWACGGGDLVLPNEGQPARVALVSGDAQTGTILEPAPESLVVRVTDRFGSPVPDVEIAWSADGGGDVQPATTTTGLDGKAATQRMLGGQPGSYGTTAVATVLPEAVVSFTTTAVAAKLVFVTQPGATASSGDRSIRSRCSSSRIPPATRWRVPACPSPSRSPRETAALRGTTSRRATPSGQVVFTDLAIIGPPGARTLIFAAVGYASAISTPVSMGVGAPAAVASRPATGRPRRPAPRCRAPRGHGARRRRDPGRQRPGDVRRDIGGGEVTGADATTGTDGIATVGSWTLGGHGRHQHPARPRWALDGVAGNPVTFTATATPGRREPGQELRLRRRPVPFARRRARPRAAITIVVRDSRSNPLAGQSVTLSATGDGVTLAQPGATDAVRHDDRDASAPPPRGARRHRRDRGVTLGTGTVTVTSGSPSVASRTSVTVPDGTAGAPTDVRWRCRTSSATGCPMPRARSP